MMLYENANGKLSVLSVQPRVLDGNLVTIVDGTVSRQDPRVSEASIVPQVYGGYLGLRLEDTEERVWHEFTPEGLNPIISWQISRLLRHNLERLRVNTDTGSTLFDLVQALKVQLYGLSVEHLAEDFGVNAKGLDHLLVSARSVYPTSQEVCAMWDKAYPEIRALMFFELESATAGDYLTPSRSLEKRLLGTLKQRETPVAQSGPRIPVSGTFGVINQGTEIPDKLIKRFTY